MKHLQTSRRRMRLPDLQALCGSLDIHIKTQKSLEVAAINEVSHDTFKFLRYLDAQVIAINTFFRLDAGKVSILAGFARHSKYFLVLLNCSLE